MIALKLLQIQVISKPHNAWLNIIAVMQFEQWRLPQNYSTLHIWAISIRNSTTQNCIQHSRIKPFHELPCMAINTAIDLCDGKIHVSQFMQLLPQTIRFCTFGQYPRRTAQLKILQLHSAFQNKTCPVSTHGNIHSPPPHPPHCFTVFRSVIVLSALHLSRLEFKLLCSAATHCHYLVITIHNNKIKYNDVM